MLLYIDLDTQLQQHCTRDIFYVTKWRPRSFLAIGGNYTSITEKMVQNLLPLKKSRPTKVFMSSFQNDGYPYSLLRKSLSF